MMDQVHSSAPDGEAPAAGAHAYNAREIAAARELCRLHSEACSIDRADCWYVYGDQFLTEARSVLAAADRADSFERK